MQLNALFMKGWRTLSACAAFIITGFLSIVGTLDLTPVIAFAVKDPAYVGIAMVGVGALFGFLRYLTNTGITAAAPETDAAYASAAGVEAVQAKIDEGT